MTPEHAAAVTDLATDQAALAARAWTVKRALRSATYTSQAFAHLTLGWRHAEQAAAAFQAAQQASSPGS